MKLHNCIPGFDFDEENDFDLSPCWFLDATHSVPPWTPMFGWFWINFCRHGMQYGAEKLSLPTTKGWDWRFKNGGGYLRIITVNDPAERRKREERFREEIRPLIEDFDGIWQGFIKEITDRYNNLKSINLEECSNIQLLENFEETINTCRRMWEIHMYMMYGVYTAFVLFEELTKQLLDIDDTSPLFLKLTSGFDNKSFQVDKGLFALAKTAQALGLEEIFLNNEARDIRNILISSTIGKEFLGQFDLYMEQEAGYRMERAAEINIPTWLEDPTPAINVIKIILSKGLDYNLDEERKKQESERLAAEMEVLGKIAPEQRGWFMTILRLAQSCSRFSEEHSHYLDLSTHAMIRRSVMAVGRRFAKAGAIDLPEDIFFIIPDEVRKVAINPDGFNLRSIVKQRKADWQEWCRQDNPPILLKDGYSLDNAMQELAQSFDPIAIKVVVGNLPMRKPEIKADLFGVCGSSGIAEGTVKLVTTESELAKIEKGDILVAPTTSSSWTPVYSMLKGIVVDRGASLSHAAIVGREYGIPVLINVFVATKVLKDGMKIRLDTNLGTITILEK